MPLMFLILLQASAACLFTGLLLWCLLSLAQRRWPALAAQRGVWLGAQLVLAAAFVLPLLPDTQQLSVVPELSVPVALAGAAPEVPLAMDAPAAALPPAASWLALPWLWGRRPRCTAVHNQSSTVHVNLGGLRARGCSR